MISVSKVVEVNLANDTKSRVLCNNDYTSLTKELMLNALVLTLNRRITSSCLHIDIPVIQIH